ncbi:HET-domain-containing protein [Poronia punctata]|nr:HET-domain-containing protein [Poronia punctata]
MAINTVSDNPGPNGAEYAVELLQHYIPAESVKNIIENINFELLLPGAPHDLVEYVRTEARKLLLITVLALGQESGLVEAVTYFRQLEATDDILPIPDIVDIDIIPRTSPLRVFCDKPWNRFGLRNFFREQWMFLAPVFSGAKFKQELANQICLPFTLKKGGVHRNGHFSTVYEVVLHPDHLVGFESIPRTGRGIRVALKILNPSGSDGKVDYNVEAVWAHEAKTLDELSELHGTRPEDTAHLIRRISAFKWCDGHYIMFEWASGGTLRDFWSTNPDVYRNLGGGHIIEFLDQICGVAKALQTLHHTNPRTETGLLGISSTGHKEGKGQSNGRNTFVPSFKYPGSGDDQSARHWRHGDLKPDNILVFEEKDRWLGVLKISDLGLAKKHEFVTEVRPGATATRHTTLHYEAPEALVNPTGRPRSRRYDIWSMGCIILESIIWLLYGYEELDSFYKEAENIDHRSQTLYFTAKRQQTNDGGTQVTEATVNQVSLHWIDHMLRYDPECRSFQSQKPSTALGEVLQLVKDELLVVEVISRASAETLFTTLDNIRKRARQDKNYLFGGTPRHRVGRVKPFRETKANSVSGNLLEVPGTRVHSQTAARSQMHLDSTWVVSDDSSIFSELVRMKGLGAKNLFPARNSVLCNACSKMSFNTDPVSVVMMEAISDVRERASLCTFCRLITQKLSKSHETSGRDTGAVTVWRVKDGLSLGSEAMQVFSLYKVPAIFLTIPTAATPDPDSQGIPTGLPKLSANFGQTYFWILRKWLADCDKNHRDCQPEMQEPPIIGRTPTRLLDVGDRKLPVVRLIETRGDEWDSGKPLIYIALSHRWGDRAARSSYCTTPRNLHVHLGGISLEDLPDTFKDAVRVSRELGVRYLWIDSLCIIQGEGGDFDEEAKHMETVFSSAYCVLAATRADGMSSGFLKPRPERAVVRFAKSGEDPVYICEAIDNFQQDVLEGPLNKRGWVLQERALARRTIYFAESQTYWECAALLGDSRFPTTASVSPKGGQIRLYELLYKQYSRLKFTHAFDRPLAIAGLEQRLIRAFETQGGYGVFIRYFGRSLLWQRDIEATPHRMLPIKFPQAQRYPVPSWSWMAYEGAITFLDLPFGKVNWQDKEIQSPWDRPNLDLTHRTSFPTIHTTHATSYWHTGNTDGNIGLSATARDFSPSADTDIVYDGGPVRPTDRILKCVLVGQMKLDVAAERGTYYVLIIARSQEDQGDTRYERVGAGVLPSSAIIHDTGWKVKVF